MLDSEFCHRVQDLVTQGKDGVEPLRRLIADNGGMARVAALMVAGLQKTNRKKAQQQSLPGMEFPDWWPIEAWRGYVEMRKAKGVAVTPSITAILVKKLTAMKSEGQDPVAVLEKATLKCWTDLYPIYDGQPGLRVVGGTDTGGEWDLPS